MTLTAVDPRHVTDPARPASAGSGNDAPLRTGDGAASERSVDQRFALSLADAALRADRTDGGSPSDDPGRQVRGAGLSSGQALPALVRAVAEHDAQAFVDRMDELLSGPVTLIDDAGAEVAASAATEVGRSAPGRSILIDDDGVVAGCLRLPATGWWSAAEEHLLRALGLVVLRGRRLAEEVLDLRHRIALSGWLAPTTGQTDPPPGHSSGPTPAVCRPVVISVPDTLTGLPARAVIERLRRACARHPQLHAVTLVPRDGGLLGVAPEQVGLDPDAQARMWRTVLDDVATDGAGVSVGKAASAGDELRASFDAAQTVANLQRRGASYLALPEVAVSEQLGPIADVLDAVSASRIPQFVERVLGELLADDRFGGQLMETLHAYLTTGGSPQEAGRLLHLHVSSVKYRMRVIRQLLGPRLLDPVQRFDLELAVRLYFAAQELAAVRREHTGRPRP